MNIFIHGALLDKHSITRAADALFGSSNLILPDLMGHGEESLAPSMYEYSINGMTFELLDRLPKHVYESGELILAGHSLGALVSMKLHLALRHLGKRGASTIILGDPPLNPIGDTSAQIIARNYLKATSLGNAILTSIFKNFEKHPFSYLDDLKSCMKTSRVILVVGADLNPSISPTGRNDPGSFISETLRQDLKTMFTRGGSQIHHFLVFDAGHHVFDHNAVITEIKHLIFG